MTHLTSISRASIEGTLATGDHTKHMNQLSPCRLLLIALGHPWGVEIKRERCLFLKAVVEVDHYIDTNKMRLHSYDVVAAVHD